MYTKRDFWLSLDLAGLAEVAHRAKFRPELLFCGEGLMSHLLLLSQRLLSTQQLQQNRELGKRVNALIGVIHGTIESRVVDICFLTKIEVFILIPQGLENLK